MVECCALPQPPHNIGLRTCQFGSFHGIIPNQSTADIYHASDDFALIFFCIGNFHKCTWLKEIIVHPSLGDSQVCCVNVFINVYLILRRVLGNWNRLPVAQSTILYTSDILKSIGIGLYWMLC